MLHVVTLFSVPADMGILFLAIIPLILFMRKPDHARARILDRQAEL